VVLPKEVLSVVVLGRVESSPSGLPWRVIFHVIEHAAASSYLRDLAASDCRSDIVPGLGPSVT
jgi:hypothetical protein